MIALSLKKIGQLISSYLTFNKNVGLNRICSYVDANVIDVKIGQRHHGENDGVELLRLPSFHSFYPQRNL